MQRFQGIGPYATLGLDMVLAIVLCLLGGWWADRKLGTKGWLTILGFLLGVATAFNILFKAARRLREETEREDRQNEARSEQQRAQGEGNETTDREHRDDDGSSNQG